MNIAPANFSSLNHPQRKLRAYGEQPRPSLSSFDQHLASVPGSFKKKSDVESTARQWVSQTFFGTLLKQMHESPFKSELWSGGRGGQAFTPMLNHHLAQRMSRGAGKKLSNAIARRLDKKAVAPKFDQPSTPSSPTGSSNPFDQVKVHVAPGLRA